MRRSPFFVSLPSATRRESARPRSTFDPDFDMTSPLLKPGRRPLAAERAVSFCLATSSGEARRRLRPPAPRRTAETGAPALPAGRPRGRPRVRPVPIALLAARPAPLWSASSLRDAFLIASSTDVTKEEAIRSSSVRRVPMRAAYPTPLPFCKGIIARAFDFLYDFRQTLGRDSVRFGRIRPTVRERSIFIPPIRLLESRDRKAVHRAWPSHIRSGSLATTRLFLAQARE